MNHQDYTLRLLQLRDGLQEPARSHFLPTFFARSTNPAITFGFSLWLGFFGIDRFVAGDWGKGILKLLTLGGLGVWVIVDWFLISGRVRNKNILRAQAMISELGRRHEPA